MRGRRSQVDGGATKTSSCAMATSGSWSLTDASAKRNRYRIRHPLERHDGTIHELLSGATACQRSPSMTETSRTNGSAPSSTLSSVSVPGGNDAETDSSLAPLPADTSYAHSSSACGTGDG